MSTKLRYWTGEASPFISTGLSPPPQQRGGGRFAQTVLQPRRSDDPERPITVMEVQRARVLVEH